MKPKFSDNITILFTNEHEEECSGRKLASEIALEYANTKCRSKCVPLSSFLDLKPESQKGFLNGFKNGGETCCSSTATARNGCSSVPKEELRTFIFIFQNHSESPEVIKFKNTVEDWITDFRVDKGVFLSLHLVFVIQEDSPSSSGDFIQSLRKLMKDLGCKFLFQEDFHIKSGDVGLILSMIDKIAEAQESYLEEELDKSKEEEEEHEEDGTDYSESEDFDIENLGKTKKGMTSPQQKKQLMKQGYKLVGEHSAVKLCRWTKSRVRGHGGCYKHTFYGINSNQCMEMTPSLACANKCVFCWRHHTNPVSTKWKWESDDPKFILEESINSHLKLIKELKGIFDTKEDRFNEAFRIRHCALSLVGEPIMYPQINELISELHKKEISTFLVTNAQFPKEMENLVPVTQLYVSIDASDKMSLKNIDRPLFRDFWERFIRCIELLKYRKERTVFRLTMVRNFNMTEQKSEIEGYANLIKLGEPDFVEIKAVTYCGTVQDNSITMKNVPWHDEVVDYAKALIEIDDYVKEYYEIVCEHRHTCCILIAKKSYFVNGKWQTWIDYPRFNQLSTKGEDFCGIDYSCETPEWALFGSPEQGFDPEDTRYPKNHIKLIQDIHQRKTQTKFLNSFLYNIFCI